MNAVERIHAVKAGAFLAEASVLAVDRSGECRHIESRVDPTRVAGEKQEAITLSIIPLIYHLDLGKM